ncbi:MAG: hypothetical protein FWG65_10105 [Turicibacter sp.]|nr:hypothetical protein [Turicibacter sp.]
MKAEYTEEDLKNAIRNPYFDKLNKRTEVALRHEVYAIYKQIGDEKGVEPEIIMRRALEMYAKRLAETE